MTSPTIDLPATAGQKLQFRWTFADDAAAAIGDELRVEVLDPLAGTATTVLVAHGTPTQRQGGWHTKSFDLSAFAGRTIRIRLSATDAGSNSLVEAGIDDVRVTHAAVGPDDARRAREAAYPRHRRRGPAASGGRAWGCWTGRPR